MCRLGLCPECKSVGPIAVCVSKEPDQDRCSNWFYVDAPCDTCPLDKESPWCMPEPYEVSDDSRLTVDWSADSQWTDESQPVPLGPSGASAGGCFTRRQSKYCFSIRVVLSS